MSALGRGSAAQSNFVVVDHEVPTGGSKRYNPAMKTLSSPITPVAVLALLPLLGESLLIGLETGTLSWTAEGVGHAPELRVVVGGGAVAARLGLRLLPSC